MTEAEALALPARELDALVAEKVMGDDLSEAIHEWRELDVDEMDFQQSTHICKRCGEGSGWEDADHLRRHPGVCNPHPRRFSTTYDGMGLVVERMIADGFEFGLVYGHLPPGEKGGPWGANFEFQWYEQIADATYPGLDTAPRAVCIAALKAKGVIG